MTEDNYRPRSPDFSSPPENPPPHAPLSPLAHRASYDASPFFNPNQRPSSSRIPQQYVPPVQPGFSFADEMARRSSRLQPEDAPVPEPAMTATMPVAPMLDETPQTRPGAGIEVKTKFPVARIKRIMQADEDVGKVAQVTPIAVCKFRIHLFFKYRAMFGWELTLCYSQGIGTLYDLAGHQGRPGSQGPQLETCHR